MAREQRTILISHRANTERAFVERGHRYIFPVVPNTFIEGGAMATFMGRRPYRRYMIVGPDYELGHIQAETFERRLRAERPGVEIFDPEAVVDALEGLELDSLRGPGRFIRRSDHQANVGSYLGVVAWADGFPDFALWKDAVYIPGDQVWRSEAEVAEIRARAEASRRVGT